MTTDGKKWHYLAWRSLQALFRGISSNHNGDFYCLNCCHSYRPENRLKKHEKVFNNQDYCYVEMPKEHNKILKDCHREKSLKAPFIIEFDIDIWQVILKKYFPFKIILKNLLKKKAEHEPSGCALSLTCSFDATKNKHDYKRG